MVQSLSRLYMALKSYAMSFIQSSNIWDSLYHSVGLYFIFESARKCYLYPHPPSLLSRYPQFPLETPISPQHQSYWMIHLCSRASSHICLPQPTRASAKKGCSPESASPSGGGRWACPPFQGCGLTSASGHRIVPQPVCLAHPAPCLSTTDLTTRHLTSQTLWGYVPTVTMENAAGMIDREV